MTIRVTWTAFAILAMFIPTRAYKPSFAIDFSGRDRDDLMRFEAGLKHTILYDIETHSGELNTSLKASKLRIMLLLEHCTLGLAMRPIFHFCIKSL